MTSIPTKPGQVYRILEQLDDGLNRVRYETCHGVRTGTQVGRYVVRDQTVATGPGTCYHCGAALPAYDEVEIDHLDRRYVFTDAMTHEAALLIADVVSCRGTTETVRLWAAAQFCRQHNNLPLQSFREWAEESNG